MQDETLEVQETELDEKGQRAYSILEDTLGRIVRGVTAHNMIEISDAVVILISIYNWSQERIAQRLGVSQTTISNYWSLRLLIPQLRARAERDEMTQKTAVKLSKLSEASQLAVFEDSEGERRVAEHLAVERRKKDMSELPLSSISIPFPANLTGERKFDRLPIEVPIPWDMVEALYRTQAAVKFEYGGRTYQINPICRDS